MEPIGQWTLQRIRGLLHQFSQLGHTAQDFLEGGESRAVIERMRNFSPRHDLAAVTTLPLPAGGSHSSASVLRELAPYFWGGLLIERLRADEESPWFLTSFVARGEYFEIDLAEQMACDNLVPKLQPDEVRRATADAILFRLPVPTPRPSRDTMAYLMTPNPETSYVWFSEVPPLWSENHMRHTLELVRGAIGEHR